MELKKNAEGSVDEAREYVEAMLGLQVYSDKLYNSATAGHHEDHDRHEG